MTHPTPRTFSPRAQLHLSLSRHSFASTCSHTTNSLIATRLAQVQDALLAHVHSIQSLDFRHSCAASTGDRSPLVLHSHRARRCQACLAVADLTGAVRLGIRALLVRCCWLPSPLVVVIAAAIVGATVIRGRSLSVHGSRLRSVALVVAGVRRVCGMRDRRLLVVLGLLHASEQLSALVYKPLRGRSPAMQLRAVLTVCMPCVAHQAHCMSACRSTSAVHSGACAISGRNRSHFGVSVICSHQRYVMAPNIGGQRDTERERDQWQRTGGGEQQHMMYRGMLDAIANATPISEKAIAVLQAEISERQLLLYEFTPELSEQPASALRIQR